MKKDVPFPAFPKPHGAEAAGAPEAPLRVARHRDGVYALLPGDESAPFPPVAPVFERRETAIFLARVYRALKLEEWEPSDS